jgi:HSP20 family molecular chaperone IbpA
MSQSRYPVARRSSGTPSAYNEWMRPSWFSSFFPWSFERNLTTGAIAPVDVCEHGNDFIVRMACAGCRPEDIDVMVEGDTIRIRGRFPDFSGTAEGANQMGGYAGQNVGGQQGNYPQGQNVGGQQGNYPQGQAMGGQQGQTGPSSQTENCLVNELPTGRFERDITLPTELNAQQCRANFENGLLTLTCPKAEHAQGHRIQISRSGQQSGQHVNMGAR